MSAKEMEAMDDEVMGVVNDHATPEAMATADELAKNERVLTPDYVPVVHQKQPVPGAKVSVRFKKTEARRTAITVALCLVIAAALILVLVVPELRFWLICVGLLGCAEVAGISLDRWFHRR